MVFTSKWNENRWSEAREKKKFYSNKFGEDISVKEFYKNKNPITSKVTSYEVSVELDYSGETYEFFMPQNTFNVITLTGFENETQIQEATKQAVSEIFKGSARTWVYDNLYVETRGLEIKEIDYYSKEYKDLQNKSFSFGDVPKLVVGKGRNKINSNKNSYDLDIWL